MSEEKKIDDQAIDEVLAMIDGKMNGGVSRLKVQFSDELEKGQVEQKYHHGRCDVGSPWAKGTVSGCDI